MLHTAGFVAESITWDPFIRGWLIILLFVVLLPGSVYLVLSTNVGARLGFMLIAAGIATTGGPRPSSITSNRVEI